MNCGWDPQSPDHESGALTTVPRCPKVIFSLINFNPDGPKAPPELEWDYPEKPGAIHPGGTVRFTCVVYHGPEGTLQWVVFSREEGQTEGIPTGEVVPPDSKSVTHFGKIV